ncbi:hypothetical protein ACFQL1_05600 [Halomicroarcula sp. GCM10025709]|uniref:DUF7312 domain-containing protein n=1 Tax=Haloarcula TaxID=2237 RepID=UPI0024C2915F|nr:hypothetical protein [Halomicroarcula sp. YJ-61-S]
MDDGDAPGPRRRDDTDGGDRFVEEYDNATEADVIRVDDTEDAENPYDDGSEAGTFSPDVEVTPGRPSVESVVFVALGVYIGLLAIGGMFAGPALASPTVLGGMTAAVAVGAAVLYGLFVRTNPDT